MLKIIDIQNTEDIAVSSDLCIWIRLKKNIWVGIDPETSESLIKKYIETKNEETS